mgnify:FL=1|tara:strand:- start:409 stop:1173 length:765 start_codon:yes stop_codon:yes gene_type:complete
MKKIALITGGARGIGQAISSVLIKDTAMMILIDKAEKELTQTVEELKNLNQNVKGIHLDLNDNKYLEKVINEILVEYKYVNILVNNAGIGSGVNPKMIHEYDDDFWEISLQINLTIPYILSKCFLPGMIKKKWGRIINISSVAGKAGFKYGGAYCASKHGLIGLTKTIALEVAQHGITVNAICPGPIDTTMLRNRLKFEISERSSSMAILEKESNAIGRFIQPEEVANLVYYLSLEKSGAITGEALNISGGIQL